MLAMMPTLWGWLGLAAAAVGLAGWARLRSRVNGLASDLERLERARWLGRLSEEPTGPTGRLAAASNRLLNALTDLNVMAIDQERELRWMHHRQLLSELAEAYTSTLEIDEMLDILCRRTSEALKIDEVAVMLVEADEVVVAATFGVPDAEQIVGLRFTIGEGLTSALWDSEDERIYVPDVDVDARFLHWKGRHPLGTASVVGILLSFQGDKLGILACTRYRADGFLHHEIESLGIVADHASVAVRNSQLYERTLELATHDELTGLLNRRQFMERLEAEWQRRERFGDPVAVLMVDIDHFKRFNDTYGHLVGDQVLARVAQTLSDTLRQIDECARYGGEEFVIMLSRTGRRGGRAVAEKLRQAVASARFPEVPEGGLNPTVSVGVAVGRPNSREKLVTEVLDRADQALLRAKETGRNKVVLAEDGAAELAKE
ncbi:MAG: diguanylate cyclase (GGDEF)-like protein [Myxococcota bacterium]|jgi:diguanylate cyclase (GGDEF)-like protein